MLEVEIDRMTDEVVGVALLMPGAGEQGIS
jgi:hypothetical protein